MIFLTNIKIKPQLLTKPLYLKFYLALVVWVMSASVYASDALLETYEIRGVVYDKETKETLVGATIYIEEFKTGTVADGNGAFLLRLPKGKFHLRISFIGYTTLKQTIEVMGKQQFVFYLERESQKLQDVTISAERSDENVKRAEMSVEKMKMQEIRQIPAFMGEVDIIKVIQLLPGVQSAAEGSSGFSVRGGNMDQNLILVDEVPIYNASHFMGFFSVFNNDAVKEMELYKGDIPVAYGGRLSSLLTVKVKEGNGTKWQGSGGIGTVSSRLAIDGPINGDTTTLMLAGRFFNGQLYLWTAQAFNEEARGAGIYFYDINAKLNHRIDKHNSISLSFYNGWDSFKMSSAKFGYGNTAGSLSWMHKYSEDVVTRFTLMYGRYGYQTSAEMSDTTGMLWNSNINDYGIKIDNTVLMDQNNTIKFGFSSTYHRFYPGLIEPIGGESLFSSYELFPNSALEWGIYGSNVQQVGEKLTLKYGLRFSIFQSIGPGTVYNYDENYKVTDSVNYGNGDIYNVYQGLEPRIGAVYQLNEVSSVKASYSRTRQYLHMASNSMGGTPLDLWIASNQNIKPQIADQAAVGYFRNFFSNKIETSVEVYYKKMDNTIDFKDHAEVFLNRHIDGELRFGESKAYGAEFQVKYNLEKLSGWVSYTRSKSIRDIPEINGGMAYNSPYDRPNDIDIVMNYQLNDRWSFSGTWVYASGTPMTLPSAFYMQDNVLQIYYKEGDRNKARMPAYHRLDLSATYRNRPKPGRRWESEWNFSIYNAYSRHNPWAINFVRDEKNKRIFAESTYLFGFLPAVTYNIKF